MKKSGIDYFVTIVPFLLVLALVLLFFIFPLQATDILGSIRGLLNNSLGIFYLIFGLFIFLLSLYMAFSKYGNIKLGLHGESMGAATSLMVLAKKPKVDFVVADCGFDNLYDLIHTSYSVAKVGFVLPSVNTAMKLRYGYDMKKTSPKDALVGNEVPVCFIHGEADTFILPENSQVNKAATAGYSELHLVPNAAHAQSREVLGEAEYRGIIGDFLNNIDFN